MPRIARVVMPGEPHHVTQRGNRRQRTFFGDEDYAEYLALMAHCLACCELALPDPVDQEFELQECRSMCAKVSFP